MGRIMRHIMVLNAKGGCGKSTLATNIASYFATQGASVALADYDPQRSSLDWLERRPADRAEIVGVAAFEDGFRHVPRSADIVVVDAPARSHGKELTDLVKHAETLIVPVLPSTIDMQATTKFIEELKNVGKVQRKQAKIGTVANRVRDNTLIWGDLDEYLTKVRVPYIAALREAQNYVRAYTRGLGIFELPEYLAWPDWEEWEPLTAWLRSKRSRP
ncbi:MAG: ParA family protein [Gammaproteobacteria bacterium]|nr:ParA family protein [Gammaproteobacteria bacterium]